MKEMNSSIYNTKLKWSKKKENKEIKHISPQKRNTTRSIVKLPSVKNTNFAEHIKYNIGEVLGEGAYAKVRLAYRKSDNMKCVIKMY